MIYIHLEMEFRLPTPLTSDYHLGLEIFISEFKAAIPGCSTTTLVATISTSMRVF